MHFRLKAPRISLWNFCLCRQGDILNRSCRPFVSLCGPCCLFDRSIRAAVMLVPLHSGCRRSWHDSDRVPCCKMIALWRVRWTCVLYITLLGGKLGNTPLAYLEWTQLCWVSVIAMRGWCLSVKISPRLVLGVEDTLQQPKSSHKHEQSRLGRAVYRKCTLFTAVCAQGWTVPVA